MCYWVFKSQIRNECHQKKSISLYTVIIIMYHITQSNKVINVLMIGITGILHWISNYQKDPT